MSNLALYDPQVHLAQCRTTQNLVTLSMQEGWVFRILGIAPMPTEEIRLSKWAILPAHLDTSAIPSHALERVQAIYAEGIRPKGFVLVHELPNEIPSGVPDVVEGEFVIRRSQEITIDLGKVIDFSVKAVGAVAVAAAAVAGVVLPAMFAVGSTLLLDPMLIAVTEHNVWVEIDFWME